MSRLIDADAILGKMRQTFEMQELYLPIHFIDFIINDMPTIEERKTGEWISKNLDNFRKYEVVCSQCGERYVGNYDAYDEPYDFNYCPCCGARMDERREELGAI